MNDTAYVGMATADDFPTYAFCTSCQDRTAAVCAECTHKALRRRQRRRRALTRFCRDTLAFAAVVALGLWMYFGMTGGMR